VAHVEINRIVQFEKLTKEFLAEIGARIRQDALLGLALGGARGRVCLMHDIVESAL
jgi:hypothetical protein